jgi:choline monooxygenase
MADFDDSQPKAPAKRDAPTTAATEARRPWTPGDSGDPPPSLVDARAYTDTARFARERSNIFLRSWFPVCPGADLARPRDFVVWDHLQQSIVITRQDDGSVRAWHNVCQHRGSRIVDQSGRCDTGKFTCPWHGFTYDLSGEVTFVPLRESFDECELRALRAPAVRVTEWAGFVWLCLADDVPELPAYLGAIGEELGFYGMDRFETRFRTSVRLHANWKLVVDAFNETWHVPFTHQDTLSGLMLWREASLKITPPHSWMTLPVRGFTQRAGPGVDHRESHLCHYLVFPNTIFSCFPTHLQMWSAWPVSVDETILHAWGVVGPEPQGTSPEQWAKQNERDWKHFTSVLDEDTAIINGWGTVARSLGFRRMMFNTAESRLAAFHQEVSKRVD